MDFANKLLHFIKILYKYKLLKRGYARLIRAIVHIFANSEWLQVTLPNHAVFWINLKDPSCIPLFMKGEVPGGWTFFETCAPKWKAMIDVGANVGMISVAVAARNPECNIVAFEPSPLPFEVLRRNCQLYPNIKPEWCAVGDRSGYTRLFLSKSSVFNSTTRSSVKANNKSVIDVPQVSLDEYARQIGGGPDIVKVDVEGGEYEVLRGAKTLIRSPHPPVWFVEVNTVFLAERRLHYSMIREAFQNDCTEFLSFLWDHKDKSLRRIDVPPSFRGNVVYIPRVRLHEYAEFIKGANGLW
ncbi:MAG: FkbM family methyltransferase [candidate division WOR-3 bacterium]